MGRTWKGYEKKENSVILIIPPFTISIHSLLFLLRINKIERIMHTNRTRPISPVSMKDWKSSLKQYSVLFASIEKGERGSFSKYSPCFIMYIGLNLLRPTPVKKLFLSTILLEIFHM